MANLKLEVLDLPPKEPNLFLCRAGELEFDVLFASNTAIEGEMTIVRFEPGGKMLLHGGGGQVHAWASQEAYQKLKHLLERTKLPPEVRVRLEKAFSEMVDRLYEWHKGDCVDPGPPESVEIKVGVKIRGTRT